MPTERDWDFGIGFALTDERFVLDEAASTYTEDNQVAGVAEPANQAPLVVRTSGPAPASVIQMMTQEGGLVGGDVPADYVYRFATTGEWYGTEDVANPRGFQVLVEADGTAIDNTKHYRAVTLPNDHALVTYQSEDGTTVLGFSDTVVAGVVDLEGNWTAYEVRGRNATPSVDFRPVPVLMGSGRILVFSWDVDEGSETAQIRMDYSDDNGQTWALGRSACLPEAIDVSSGNWTCLRIVATETEGGIAMVVHLQDGSGVPSSYRDVLRQYASRNIGHGFELVSNTDEDRSVDRQKTGASPVIVDVDGVMIVAWVGVDTSGGTTYPIYAARLGNAFDPVFLRDDGIIVDSTQDHGNTSGSPATFSEADLAACRDHGGPLYITSRLPTALARAQVLYRSDDGGRSWGPVGISELIGTSGSPWSYSASAGVYIRDVALTAQASGLTAFGRKVTPGGFRDDSLHAIRLGGPSTVTYPPYFRADTELTQTSPEYIWLPYDLPQASGRTALGPVTGTPTVTLAGDYVEVDAAGGTHSWVDTLPGGSLTATNGGHIERQFTLRGGGSLSSDAAVIRVQAIDGTQSYQVTVRLAAGGFRVMDDNAGGGAGAPVGSDATGMSLETRYEVKIALEGGVVRTWWRPWTWAGLEPYVDGPTGVVTSAASGGTQVVVTWGCPVASNTVIRWHAATAAWDNGVGAGLAAEPFTNPGDLRGRPWTPDFMAIGTSGSLVAADGASTRADQVQIDPTSEEGVHLVTEGGPRTRHVASGTAAETYIYDLQGGADTPMGTDVLVLAEFGSNVSHVKVSGVPASGSDVVLVDTSLCIGLDDLLYERQGDCIRPPVTSPGSDVNTPLSELMEYAGCQWASWNGSAWVTRTIARNTGGSWSEGAGRRDALFLEGVDSGDPTSGTDGKIIPKDWAVLIDMRGAVFEKIKVEFPTPSATVPGPASGKHTHGRRILGYLVPHFHHPSWGNRVSAQGHAEVLQTPDQQRRGVELAPVNRTFRLGLVDGLNTYNVVTTSLDAQPDWFEVSSHASAEGIGTPGLELHSLEGMLRVTRGGLDELAYFPYLPRFDGVSRAQVLNRREELGLVAFDPSTVIARSRINGQTMHGEHIRGDVFELVEVA